MRRRGLGREQVEGEVFAVAHNVGKIVRGEAVGREVEKIHPPLGELGHFVEVGLGAFTGCVEGDDAGVVVVGTVDGAGAEAEDEARHAGLRIDVGSPCIGIEGEADSGELGIEVLAVEGARHAHDQQGHLFVAVEHPTVGPVAQGFFGHGAGIDFADGGQQVLQAFLARALVGAEDAFVGAREGVAVVVLQQRAGAHDERRLAEIVQHFLELPQDVGRKLAGQQQPAGFVGALEERVRVALFLANGPRTAAHEEIVEDVGADKERIVFLQQLREARVGLLDDRARQQEADGLAANEAGADHPAAHVEDVRQGQVAGEQLLHPGIARDDHLDERVECFLRAAGNPVVHVAGLDEFAGTDECGFPEAGAAVGREARPLLRGQDFGKDGARGDGTEFVAAPDVEHVLGGEAALVGLDRPQIDFAAMAEDVNEERRGGADRVEGVGGMVVTVECEIGHAALFAQTGNSQLYETGQHLVGIPIRREPREAVADDEHAGASPFDCGMDRRDEILKALGGIQCVDRRAGVGRQQGFVAGEPEVEQLAAVASRCRRKRRDQLAVFLDGIDLPRDDVAGMQAGHNLIQAWQPRGQRRLRHAVDHRPRGGSCPFSTWSPWGRERPGALMQLSFDADAVEEGAVGRVFNRVGGRFRHKMSQLGPIRRRQ